LTLFLVLLAASTSVGLYLLVKNQVERRGSSVSELVAERLQAHLGQQPLTLREMEMQAPFSQRVVAPLIRRGSQMLARTTPTRQRDTIEAKLRMAGKYSLDAGTFLVIRLAVSACLLLLGALLGFLLAGPLAAVVGGAVLLVLGYMLPGVWLGRSAKQRVKEMRKMLPDVLDLLTITVQAGLSFDAAMARVGERYSTSALGQEFNQVLQETRLGRPRLEALAAMGQRVQVEEVRGFTQAVVQSEQMGVGIGKLLRLQADDLRRSRIQKAKEKAGRATLIMLLPMVGCIFPTLFVILLGPAALMLLAVSRGG
jgi:tight adherence protein C